MARMALRLPERKLNFVALLLAVALDLDGIPQRLTVFARAHALRYANFGAIDIVCGSSPRAHPLAVRWAELEGCSRASVRRLSNEAP